MHVPCDIYGEDVNMLGSFVPLLASSYHLSFSSVYEKHIVRAVQTIVRGVTRYPGLGLSPGALSRVVSEKIELLLSLFSP